MSQDAELAMRVVRKREVADGVVALDLEPRSGGETVPTWAPGAHVDLVGPDGLVRQYSLCGPADDRGFLRVAVLRTPDSRGGSAWVHERLAEGDALAVRGPRNHFALRDHRDYLFVAGGIGITPILPMIRDLERAGRRWRLAYGGRSRRSMAFLGELESYGDRVTVHPEDEVGLMDLERVLGEPAPGRGIYCCGPEPLIAAVEERLAGRPEQLRVEHFRSRGREAPEDEEFEVEIASTGKVVRVAPGESIVDALATVGVQVEFSCREGTCGTCETGVLAGVPEHRDSVLDEDERAANDCMMVCVGRCVEGPLLLDL